MNLTELKAKAEAAANYETTSSIRLRIFQNAANPDVLLKLLERLEDAEEGLMDWLNIETSSLAVKSPTRKYFKKWGEKDTKLDEAEAMILKDFIKGPR